MVCQWPVRIPQGRPRKLPTGGQEKSPAAASRSPLSRLLGLGTSIGEIEQVGQSDRLVAVGAATAGTDPAAEGPAVRALLFSKGAGVADRALVDGRRSGRAIRQQRQRRRVALSPASLATDIGTEASSADPRAGGPTDRTGYRYAVVTQREVRHAAPPLRALALPRPGRPSPGPGGCCRPGSRRRGRGAADGRRWRSPAFWASAHRSRPGAGSS